MKKLYTFFLVSLLVFVNTLDAQQDRTIIEEDTFLIKKVNIVDRNESTIPLSGNKSTQNSKTKSSTSAKSSSSGIGETPGSLSVSLSGGANYDIPIAVPPGVNGIMPEISLTYNSQVGDGIAGYGWNISGISTISRIPSSKHHDNHIDGVDIDELDRFALDGERLILKSGTYGGNDAIYETENFSNIKVTSYGTSPYGSTWGPSYFIVNYPDGSIARYGDSVDSRSHTNYSITYWENPQGVRINYEYEIEYKSQSISKIKYGSLYSNAPINEITFNYSTKPRRDHSAINSNISIIRRKILTGIESYSSGVRYRAYKLLNTDDRTTLYYPRLTSVREYNSDGTESHSPIIFSYSNSDSSVTQNEVITDLNLVNIEQRNAQAFSMDMTGNGKMDFIVYPNTKNKFWAFSNLQSGITNQAHQYDIGNFESVFSSNLLNNQNKVLSGQGLTLVQKGSGNQVNFRAFGTPYAGASGPLSYHYTKIWHSPTYTINNTTTNYEMEYVSGDFNGDGLTDVLAIGKPYNSYSYYRSVFFINLKRDLTTGFANQAGYLNLKLSGDYKLKTGDFNGDGKTDLLHITNGKLYVYSFDQNNNLILLWETEAPEIIANNPFMMGDYNGDGKTDFMTPTNNNSNSFVVFTSNSWRFEYSIDEKPFTYRATNWNGDNGVLSGYNLIPLDVNGDGKTDIVEYNTVTTNWSSNGTQTIKVYNNLRIGSTNDVSDTYFSNGGSATITGNLEHFPIPIYLTSNQQNKSLDFASISNKWVTNFSFTHDHREDVLLKGIENNGVSYEIDYSNLDSNVYNDNYDAPSWQPHYKKVYHQDSNQIYPNIDLSSAPSTSVVTTIKRYANLSSGTEMTKKVYVYKGAVFNAEGLGFLGFSAIARSNWHTDNTNRIFSISKFSPSLRGAMVEEYSMENYHNFTTPTSNYISKTAYQYSSSLSNNKVFKLWVDSSFNQNYLEGTFTNKNYQYDGYNNPTNISTTFMGGSKNKTISYSNSTGSDYHIGRPTDIITSTTIGGETFNTEQQFSYSSNLLTQTKTKGNGTEFNTETYEYDDFGNIYKKTTTPYEEPSREVIFKYDSTGRFMTNSYDIENLETKYEYDISTGNLTKVINPFGQETRFKYDSWNRQAIVIDYLGKGVKTKYEEVNNAYTVASLAEDNSGIIVEYDQLQRVSVVKEVNLFGEWISKKYEYDDLGRLIKESQPYTGNSPTQWNETAYDIYGRPISHSLYTGRTINISYDHLTTTVDDGVKTVVSTRNQFGGVASITDPGATINYTYYGNGSLKTADNNGVLVVTEQDGWGRKTKLIDPSAGTYEYEYNGYGEMTKEITPKGITDYTYSPLGKLLKKIIEGDHIEMSINYMYDATNKLLEGIELESSDGNNSNYHYDYDNDLRLTSVSEENPYAEFNKKYTYDDFGRIDSEEYYARLFSNNKISFVKTRNKYQNGALKTIEDFSTNKNIWDATSVNERGQITTAAIGDNIVDDKSYNTYGYLTASSVSKVNGADSEVLMKLTTDFNVQRGTLNSRTNDMFSWSETFEYDDLDRLITFNDNNGDNEQVYDDLGRITDNNAIGKYNYTSTSYQIDSIDLNENGNSYYQENKLQQVKYNAFKKPFEINEDGKEKINFQYNAFMGRSHMFYGNDSDHIEERKLNKHYSFDGSMEINHDLGQDKTYFVTYIGGDAYSAPAIWRSEEGGEESNYYYLHRDYLGSIMLITDSEGKAKEKRHFDAWGNIVQLTDGNNNPLDKLTILDRGYTGHEHLQGVKLIHMNGRLYDSKLKRFLSPDNHIQDITNTQNYNRYGYVLNNPLMYIDPTGETGEDPNSGPDFGGYEGSLIGSAVGTIIASVNWEGLRWNDVDNWWTKQWNSVRGLQIGRWIGGWFKKRGSGPVEYANYEGLSSDPVAGSSANTPNAFFNAGGAESGLGVARGDLAKYQAVMDDFKTLLLMRAHNDAMTVVYKDNPEKLLQHLMNTELNMEKTNSIVGKQTSHLHSANIEFDSDYNVISLKGKGEATIIYASPRMLSYVVNGIAGQIDGKDIYKPNPTWGAGQDTYTAGWYPVSFHTGSGSKGYGINFIGFKTNEDRIKFNNYWKNIRDEIIRQHSN